MSDESTTRNALWASTLVDELVASGVGAVCIAPGSRSTPLVVAAAAHEALRTFSHLDERSAAFFALGRGRRTGEPTAVITTSGTAAAELHPAILEADRGRVPLLAITADRPAELRDAGANQTVDQERLYGDAVRWYRGLPEPAAAPRTLRRLRTDAARAVDAALGPPAGPVHCNVPFHKPLAPIPGTDDIPAGWHGGDELAASGRDGPYVTVTRGRPTLDDAATARLADEIAGAKRGLLVAGPADPPADGDDGSGHGSGSDDGYGAALIEFAAAAGLPILADPLSDLRFSSHLGTDGVTVLGGYDAYLDERVTDEWPSPDLVFRVGASPTSKPLREYLARCGARQLLVDPAGGWREATFTASDAIVASPGRLARGLAEQVDRSPNERWHERLRAAEATHWELASTASASLEGSILATVAADAPDPATLVVSNSMPVRDLDRFGRPRPASITTVGNRGASGIDGVTSTALGAGSATDEPLVLVTGDLAYYHDANGLLAIHRCEVDATIVLVNNDGGGIFHSLPIESVDPPFTEQFKTPHGLEFEPTAELYDIGYQRVAPEEFPSAYRDAVTTEGTQVVAVRTDAAASHRERESLREALVDRVG